MRSGVLTMDVALCKSGPICHSRWVTTADTIIELYQSDHGLEGELLQRLETIVTYIVSVYCPMWFEIKVWLDYIFILDNILQICLYLRSNTHGWRAQGIF